MCSLCIKTDVSKMASSGTFVINEKTKKKETPRDFGSFTTISIFNAVNLHSFLEWKLKSLR